MQYERIVDTPDKLARHFADRVQREWKQALAAHGRFAIAIPGGSTAEALLPALCTVAVDWHTVDVFWLDERAVAPDHADSNYRVARETWLSQVAVPPERLHRLRGEAADLDVAAFAAERELRRTLGAGGRIDVALAGVGPDGHVASLFPDHPSLGEPSRWMVAVEDSPKPPPRRLTMTLRAFAAVDLLVVAAFGAGKAEAVGAAVDPQSPLPVARAARRARRRLLLLDDGAARLLRER